MKIELLYFDDCPSYQTARDLLSEVLKEEGLSGEIKLIEIRTDADAQLWKFAGSPTIRIDDVDPFPRDETNYGLECRVYQTPQGYSGWPTKEMLQQAVRQPNGMRHL
jgi:hypothetical protein